MTQWVGHPPASPGVTSWIPGVGTCLGCGPGPQLGALEAAGGEKHLCFSLSFSLPSSLKRNKIFFFEEDVFIVVEQTKILRVLISEWPY